LTNLQDFVNFFFVLWPRFQVRTCFVAALCCNLRASKAQYAKMNMLHSPTTNIN
jgi:hypothetical protein